MNLTKYFELNDPQNSKILDLLIKIPENIGTPKSLLVHTLVFLVFLTLPFVGLGLKSEQVNIFFTTLLSLEAIYLAIFIQMSVNRSNQNIQDLSEDLDDIQEDIVDIQGDIDYMNEEDELINLNPNSHITMSQQIEMLQKQIQTMSLMIDKMKDEVKK
jgi:uncharacterized membrane protein